MKSVDPAPSRPCMRARATWADPSRAGEGAEAVPRVFREVLESSLVGKTTLETSEELLIGQSAYSLAKVAKRIDEVLDVSAKDVLISTLETSVIISGVFRLSFCKSCPYLLSSPRYRPSA